MWENAVLLPLFATTGPTSLAQMRRLFLGFCHQSQNLCIVLSRANFVHYFHNAFSTFLHLCIVFSKGRIYIGKMQFCFHSWRRRDPPESLRCGDYFSGFTIKVKIYVLFYKGRKFFTGKTNGFFTFFNFSLHLHKEHCKTRFLIRVFVIRTHSVQVYKEIHPPQ